MGERPAPRPSLSPKPADAAPRVPSSGGAPGPHPGRRWGSEPAAWCPGPKCRVRMLAASQARLPEEPPERSVHPPAPLGLTSLCPEAHGPQAGAEA